ncbi:MAG: diguanylate cyclase [Actinomycetota bacterium]|nr:diguanylate cyclase [Actinomycetota bacterium]
METISENNFFASENPIYYHIVENIKEGILVVNKDLKLTFANRKFLKTYSYDFEDIAGKSLSGIFGKKDNYSWKKIIRNIEKLPDAVTDFSIKRKDKTSCLVKILISSLIDDKGYFDGAIILIRDITKEKKAEEKIKYFGFHDIITGLYNRAYFEEELKRLNNERYYPLSIIIGDLNGFKLINDVFGHLKGDEMLKKVADILRNSCRKSDIIARYGGDEFVVLLPKADKKALENITGRIKKACRELNSQNSFITISIGTATKYDYDNDLDALLIEAESAMYNQKIDESREAKDLIFAHLKKSYQERRKKIKEDLNNELIMADRLGKSLNLNKKSLTELKLLIKLHDIGMVVIPEEIINKPGFLTAKEKKLVQKHSEAGYRIAESRSNVAVIADSILHHHENWDGTGYPKGLKGTEIPLLSRVAAVVNAYDAMINDRPYRKALSEEKVKNELKKSRGKQFDPFLIDCILHYLNF